jgi:DNA-binding MarR family transcriptional regulator
VSHASLTVNCYATAARKASRRLTALYDDVLAPVSLRSTQYAILQELAAGDELTLNDLASVLVLDRSGLGHSLRPLERDGLVRLDKNPGDGRSVIISMTEQGRRRYKEATALWRSAQDQVASVLGEPTATRIRKQMNAIGTDDRLVASAREE